MKTNEDYYLEIGRIANESSRPVKMSELSEQLNLENNRGTYSRVRGAYKYYLEKGDEHTAAQIRKTFIDEEGYYPYM